MNRLTRRSWLQIELPLPPELLLSKRFKTEWMASFVIQMSKRLVLFFFGSVNFTNFKCFGNVNPASTSSSEVETGERENIFEASIITL